MGDLRKKISQMGGVPSGWADVGNLPEVPEQLLAPLKELLQAMGEMKEFVLSAVKASPKVKGMFFDREQFEKMAIAEAYLAAWATHLQIRDESPWWNDQEAERFANKHPLLGEHSPDTPDA